MVVASPSSVGRWYEDGAGDGVDGPDTVLAALRDYRLAELAMRKRTREDMSMNETDITAVRYVLRARMRDEAVTPTDLMNHLGVTMASVTVMIDRLESGGYLRREMNPNDRRSRLVTSTDRADREVGSTLEAMHSSMMTAVEGMTAEETETVIAFLTRMERAVDAILPAR